jgi:hypothetical protein
MNGKKCCIVLRTLITCEAMRYRARQWNIAFIWQGITTLYVIIRSRDRRNEVSGLTDKVTQPLDSFFNPRTKHSRSAIRQIDGLFIFRRGINCTIKVVIILKLNPGGFFSEGRKLMMIIANKSIRSTFCDWQTYVNFKKTNIKILKWWIHHQLTT